MWKSLEGLDLFSADDVGNWNYLESIKVCHMTRTYWLDLVGVTGSAELKASKFLTDSSQHHPQLLLWIFSRLQQCRTL